jgi:elongation factor G
MKDDVELYREETIEKICELDDDLMEQFLDDKIPSIDEMKKVLRKACIENAAVPVFAGSA